mgnify:CR=1 FL=1
MNRRYYRGWSKLAGYLSKGSAQFKAKKYYKNHYEKMRCKDFEERENPIALEKLKERFVI